MPYFLTSRSLTTCARSKLNFWLKAGVPVAESAYPLIVYVAFGDSFILLARYDKFISSCGDNLSEPILKNTVRGAMLVSVITTSSVSSTSTGCCAFANCCCNCILAAAIAFIWLRIWFNSSSEIICGTGRWNPRVGK